MSLLNWDGSGGGSPGAWSSPFFASLASVSSASASSLALAVSDLALALGASPVALGAAACFSAPGVAGLAGVGGWAATRTGDGRPSAKVAARAGHEPSERCPVSLPRNEDLHHVGKPREICGDLGQTGRLISEVMLSLRLPTNNHDPSYPRQSTPVKSPNRPLTPLARGSSRVFPIVPGVAVVRDQSNLCGKTVRTRTAALPLDARRASGFPEFSVARESR